jgi:glycosyl transferase family 25
MYAYTYAYDSFYPSSDKELEHFIEPSSVMKYIDHIFYINLDKRTDRKEEIEKELNQYGLPYERFSAIYDPFGAVGCTKSHLSIITLAKERGYKRILILEDDFSFVVSRDVFENTMKQVCEKPFDVCMLAYNLSKSESVKEPFWKRLLHGLSTSAYLVNSHYYDTLLSTISESIPLLQQTQQKHNYAIDVVYTRLQQKDKWYHTTERMGVQAPSYSDIENSNVNYGV